MSMKKFFILVLIAAVMLGCAASSRKLNNVKIGMTKSEVIEVMGEPNYVSAIADLEILNYKLTSGIFSDEYIVRIKEGKVDLFGSRYSFGSIY